MLKKSGFVFIETIIVICVLTVGLMSLYSNYSKIIKNTNELNTHDTAEYNYKTYYLKELLLRGNLKDTGNNTVTKGSSSGCYNIRTPYSDVKLNGTKYTIIMDGTSLTYGDAKVCILLSAADNTDYFGITNIDAYIIDYLNMQDLNSVNDDLFLAKYKKYDKQTGEYFTYISSLTF